jgi:hypothetical protein
MLGGKAMPSARKTRPTSPVTGVRSWETCSKRHVDMTIKPLSTS